LNIYFLIQISRHAMTGINKKGNRNGGGAAISIPQTHSIAASLRFRGTRKKQSLHILHLLVVEERERSNLFLHYWRLQIATPKYYTFTEISTNHNINTLANCHIISFPNCFPLLSIVFIPPTSEIIVSYSTIPPFQFSHCRIVTLTH
jgi:hypothetical protein